MESVKLAELLEGVPAAFMNEGGKRGAFSVSSVSTDSRSLKKGELFVALPGEVHDGHDFIAEALRKGVSGVLFESAKKEQVRGLADDNREVLFIGVPSTRRALGKMAENYLRLFTVKKIVVTGSAGKTTTTRLAASVLSRRYEVVSSPRSYNNDIGVPMTAFMVGRRTKFLVQEIGTNHPGEVASLSGIVHQDCALITNIGPAHVGFFGSEDNIAREKKSALECLADDGVAFLNAGDRYFEFLKKGLAARVLSFGIESGDLRPDRILEVGVDSVEFVLGDERIRARITGIHGVLNATAAALLGLGFGLSFREIRDGIESYTPEGGRGNVYKVGGVTIIDESYNANPLSLRASLAHIGRVQVKGRRVFVFADMLELGELSELHHRGVAEDILRSGVDALFTFGQFARITGEECRRLGLKEVAHFSTVEDLVKRLKDEINRGGLREGDFILVKGSRAMKLDRVVQSLLNR